MKVFLSLGFLLYWSAMQTNAQSIRCVNPNQRAGSCVSIYDCQTLMSVLERKPLQQDDVAFVKASACAGSYGRAPHVCCASDTSFAPKYFAPVVDARQIYWATELPRTNIFPNDYYNYNSNNNENNNFFGNAPSSSRRGLINRRGFEGRQQRFAPTQASFAPSPSISRTRSNLIPQPPTCGGVTIENKIYGGSDTDLREFPWMVLFEYNRKAGGVSVNCAGSLINQRYVLTAAHCVKGAIERQIGQLTAIRVGEHDLNSQVDCNAQSCAPESIRVGIDEIIAHELYTDTSLNKENDIALVRLDRNLRFTDTVRPICLPSVVKQEQQVAKPGTQYTVAGWGRTLKSAKSAIKQKLNVALIDQQQCNRKFRERKVNIVDSQLCAGGKFAEDSCEGDSGGPLMRFRGGAWVLEGIVSFGVKCGLRDWPAIHTRVASFDNWIRSKIRA